MSRAQCDKKAIIGPTLLVIEGWALSTFGDIQVQRGCFCRSDIVTNEVAATLAETEVEYCGLSKYCDWFKVV